MQYLQNKTLELIIYLLFRGDLIDEPPSEFFTDLFASEIDNILEDLKEHEIDSCISFGKNKTTAKLTDRKTLNKFVNEYIRNFEGDKLEKDFENYYSFEKHMSIIPRFLLEPYFDKFRKTTFNIDYQLDYVDLFSANENLKLDFSNNLDDCKNEIQTNLRLYELLLFLYSKKYIKINATFSWVLFKTWSTGDRRESVEHCDYVLVLSINFNKSPMEIYDINKYWLYYGDIRVNATDGIGFYKQNRYPFQHTKGKAFKLLCHLVKNHGKAIFIIDTYNLICADDIEEEIKLTEYEKEKKQAKENKNKKDKIKEYIKEIKKNLKINEDENPSISIMVNDENVMLISNPPI